MDALCRLHQLANLVRAMRELQKVCFKSIHDARLDRMMTLEGQVDDLLDSLLGGIVAPIPPALVADLFTFETSPPPPPPPPPPLPELFTALAEQLRELFPDLAPPPARELPDLDQLFRQWNPDEEKKS